MKSIRSTSMLLAAIAVTLAAGCGGSDEQLPDANASLPAGEQHPYENASLTRGGKLYDRWWNVSGSEPSSANPGYALTAGKQTGSGTWRCKECHGWDYRGAAGAYGTGSRFTGVRGLLGTTRSRDELFAIIRDGVPGQAMSGFGAHLSDADIWDLVKFVREGVVDLAPYIDLSTNSPIGGNPDAGRAIFESTCVRCHGFEGKGVNFGTVASPSYLGNIANDNPWEFQHKLRFGPAGRDDMPTAVGNGWSMQTVIDILSHVRTLPRQ